MSFVYSSVAMAAYGAYQGEEARRDASRNARQAARAEAERQARINRGREDIRRIFGEQFTPEFYEGVERDYRNWAMPQLQRQGDEAGRNLSYALARAGTTRSSAAAKGKADLQYDFDMQRQNIAKSAADLANRRRSEVEGNRQQIESQLYATADPIAAAESSRLSSNVMSFTPEYSPLGQLLTDASGWYGMAQQAGMQLPFQRSAPGGSTSRSSSGYRVRG